MSTGRRVPQRGIGGGASRAPDEVPGPGGRGAHPHCLGAQLAGQDCPSSGPSATSGEQPTLQACRPGWSHSPSSPGRVLAPGRPQMRQALGPQEGRCRVLAVTSTRAAEKPPIRADSGDGSGWELMGPSPGSGQSGAWAGAVLLRRPEQAQASAEGVPAPEA